MEQAQATEPQNQSLNVADHDAAMVAKAEAAASESMEKDRDEFTGEEETSLLAGKYKTPEDLEKAYKELESKLGQKQEPEETKEEIVEAPSNPEEAQELAESKGVDFTALNDEFANSGSLSEDTYKMLEGKGIGKDMVDAYIAGQQAIVEQNITKLQQLTGGEEGYTSMVEWAQESLNDAEKDAFNKSLESEAGAQFAIQGLYARYKAEAEPSLISGQTSNTPSGGYESSRQMMQDMASAQYRNDPAFRALVQQRVSRSKF